MPKDEMTQKEAWELAWERSYPKGAEEVALGFTLPAWMTEHRERFKAGYLAAKAEQEAAVGAGRELLLKIGGNSEEAWQQNDRTFEHAAELADALAKLVGYPQWSDEADGYVYSDEPTKEPT